MKEFLCIALAMILGTLISGLVMTVMFHFIPVASQLAQGAIGIAFGIVGVCLGLAIVMKFMK